MKRIKVSEIARQIRGVSYKPGDLHNALDENSVILLRANNIANGEIIYDDIEFVDKSRVQDEQYLKAGDILICASSGSKQHVGKAVSINSDMECTFGAFCKVIRPKDEYSDYLGAYFQSRVYRDRISAASLGANINNIRNEHIDNLAIPDRSPADRAYIAESIGIVRSVIDHRRSQLALLNELIKARFVEMFGDPINNTNGWEMKTVVQVCETIYGGGTPSKKHPEYFTGIIPWVSPKDMKTMTISDSIDHITDEAIANSTTNLIQANSVLMVIRSGILKHTLPVAINRVAVTINQDMKAFVPNDMVKAEYLMYYFKAIEMDVLAGVRAVTADNINFKEFQKREIIVPPLELQQQFVSYLEQVDKSKFWKALVM